MLGGELRNIFSAPQFLQTPLLRGRVARSIIQWHFLDLFSGLQGLIFIKTFSSSALIVWGWSTIVAFGEVMRLVVKVEDLLCGLVWI